MKSASSLKTWCPECGPDVAVDADDGCCAACGATATGQGADRAVHDLRVKGMLVEALEAVEFGNLIPGYGPACPWCNAGEPRNNPGSVHQGACPVGRALAEARKEPT